MRASRSTTGVAVCLALVGGLAGCDSEQAVTATSAPVASARPTPAPTVKRAVAAPGDLHAIDVDDLARDMNYEPSAAAPAERFAGLPRTTSPVAPRRSPSVARAPQHRISSVTSAPVATQSTKAALTNQSQVAPSSAPVAERRSASEGDRARAEENRRAALAHASAADRARRDDARLPLVPYHDDGNRFAGLPVLGSTSVRDMIFYDYGVNPTISVRDENVSTFAIDVDTASYNMVRSYLDRGVMPDERAIRVEEMINAFDYAYRAPESEPFLVQAEAFPSPNRRGYHVLHVGMKGRETNIDERRPTMLAFVVDVSGSMEGENRLGLVQRSLTLLTRNLDGRDTVGIVVYGTTARVALEPTHATESGKHRIIDVLAGLSTEGSTNVEAGLALGYEVAGRFAGPGLTSRVILCSDGVANTGATDADHILQRVAEQASRGVTISTVGFGMGTYNDVLMERLADKGNGNYAYVDTLEAAQKVFGERLGATLDVIAKDVKVQVAFDERTVDRYRLLGFENRMLDKRDFSSDLVDAGEIGAGHTVTAIYEVKLRSPEPSAPLGELRVRYKDPSSSTSRLLERSIPGAIVRRSFAQASAPTKLSLVVAAFAEKLRGAYWARNESYDDILARLDELPESLRHRADVAELRTLITTARSLDRRGDRFDPLLPVAKMDFDRVPVLY